MREEVDGEFAENEKALGWRGAMARASRSLSVSPGRDRERQKGWSSASSEGDSFSSDRVGGCDSPSCRRSACVCICVCTHMGMFLFLILPTLRLGAEVLLCIPCGLPTQATSRFLWSFCERLHRRRRVSVDHRCVRLDCVHLNWEEIKW